jgi:hypothetical protein
MINQENQGSLELKKNDRVFAFCIDCEAKGLPSGFHTVSKDVDNIYVECSTCGKLVVKLKLGEKS